MSFQDLVNAISEIQDQTVFVRFDPEILDFTDKESSKEISIYLQNNKFISIPLKDQDLFFLISMLKVSLFAKGMKILCWNWKSFCSYVLNKTGSDYLVGGSVIDLKVIESYLGKRSKAPKDLKEALIRLKCAVSDGSWKSIEGIYKNLHVPLMTTTIPHLENSGAIDTSKGCRVFANYDINGQENGRLLCSGSFKNSFIPHAMSPQARSTLRPIGLDENFMSFDFRAMEVYMLAWLSKDPILEDLCSSKDVYCSLYEKILGKKPEKKSDRDFMKKCFLPVIYGQSPYSLGQRCGIPKESADSIVNRINSLFSVSVGWVCSQEQQLKNNGFSIDHFGKRRYFDEGKEYLVRNFCVQSPAAVVCLEKLCNLSFALKGKTSISFMVHDSYTVYFNKENWKEVYNISEQILLGESSFCSNLKLKFSCRVGKNLNELKLFKPRESLNAGDLQQL
jgi:hypothetical protein